MAESTGSNFPWASIAILVAFISSTLLVPTAFERLRPPEKERAQPAVDVELEVDARLWEDPFIAARRHESERDERCAKQPAKTSPECSTQVVQRRTPSGLMARLDEAGGRGALDHDWENTLVIAALVPGNPFVGAEESRRRTRYATLAGLQVKGYVPINADRIGLLHFEMAASAPGSAASAARPYVVPYELLTRRPALRSETPAPDEHFARIALLWIDEATLAQPKLDSLAKVFDGLIGDHRHPPRLVVIGPSSSDGLRTALAELGRASKAAGEPERQALKQGYGQLARATILSPFATAPDRALDELNEVEDSNGRNVPGTAVCDASTAGRPRTRLEKFLDLKLKPFGAPAEVDFERTIATDSRLLRTLVNELTLRLPSERRVVLVAERDSLYAQALVSEFMYRVCSHYSPERGSCKSMSQDTWPEVPDRPKIEVVYYFRGLDGVTTRDGADKDAAERKPKAESPIEWPETRDQLDYLRRVAGVLKDSEGAPENGAIGAIGVLGFDVHDKLLVLQALRDSFSDKVFFTTDMDARYLHPRTQAFTRNLVVASSLPLAFPSAEAQDGVPPFRDVYQSATYVAARRAACRIEACREDERELFAHALRCPSVYEIGRSHAVPLSGYAFRAATQPSQRSRAVAAVALVLVLTLALVVWPSTPAMKQARAAILRQPAPHPGDCDGLTHPAALTVAFHFALLMFVIGSAFEFVTLGKSSPWVLAALAAAVGAGVFVALRIWPPDSVAPPRRAPTADEKNRRYALSGAVLVVVVSFAVRLLWPEELQLLCTDCEPVAWLEGVSAWSSHMIHLVALILIVWALDDVWSKARQSRRLDSQWLALPAVEDPLPPLPRWMRLKRWFPNYSLAWWPGRAPAGSVDFPGIWCEYVRRGRGSARTLRILFWYATTVAVVTILYLAFSDGYRIEVPVRGERHRALIGYTFYAVVFMLPLVVVAVADSTMLPCRFFWHLNHGRSMHARETVERFAQALGGEQSRLWLTPIAREPSQRCGCGAGQPYSGVAAAHSLLDDWIDIQVVTRRTQQVAPLIIGPFVVLALMVVARSRLIDAWALTLPVAVAAAAYCAWLILLAVLLKQAAERTRSRALERMQEDLRWLEGSQLAALKDPFKRLIESVQNSRSGAFASFFDQPLFKALLVPLGGAGGAQLFDHLLGR